MGGGGGSRLKEAVLKMPAARVTWLSALFLTGYVGVEVGLGGWIVTFMIRVREADRFASGMTATGFWLGLTVGRVVLGFITGRIGETLAIMVRVSSSCIGYVLIECSDLPTHIDGTGTPLLARSSILRWCYIGRITRFLLRTAFPCSYGCLHEIAPEASARVKHWLRSCIRWKWRCDIPLCYRCHCAGEGCAGIAAYHPGTAGCDLRFMAGIAEDEQEEGMRAFVKATP